MSISGTILYNKLREIMPELASSITPEVLNKTSDDPIVQPFLKWFCSSVGRENVFLPEDTRLKQHIKKQGEWLEGEELDAALAEATKDCPELLKLLETNAKDVTKLSDELEAEKDAYKEVINYIKTLEDNRKSLNDLNIKLDEDIDTEESELKKDRIKVQQVYHDCIATVEESDSSHRDFFEDIESLVTVYNDATEKKGPVVTLNQVPLDLFIKQMEMYNDCLGVYVKRQFAGKIVQNNDSDYSKLINNSKEQCDDEKVCELLNCQTSVITSKTDEINGKIEEAICSAMAEHTTEIYDSKNLRIPLTETQLGVEIAALTAKRDILEDKIALTRETQLEELIRQYARMMITKILVNDGQSRVARRKRRLEILENLLKLAREKGHSHSDLLLLMMQQQLRRLKEIVEFVADGRHYLETEYNLSSIRSENMRQQQAKFNDIMNSLPSEQNVFNKIFISLLGTESQPDELNAAIKEYGLLVDDNKKRMKDLLSEALDTRIDNIKKIHDQVMSIYNAEIEDGVTNSFKATPFQLISRFEDSTQSVHDAQDMLKQIRARIKDMHRKTAENSFERFTTILWQLFLASPEELQSKYDEAKSRLESARFAKD